MRAGRAGAELGANIAARVRGDVRVELGVADLAAKAGVGKRGGLVFLLAPGAPPAGARGVGGGPLFDAKDVKHGVAPRARGERSVGLDQIHADHALVRVGHQLSDETSRQLRVASVVEAVGIDGQSRHLFSLLFPVPPVSFLLLWHSPATTTISGGGSGRGSRDGSGRGDKGRSVDVEQ